MGRAGGGGRGDKWIVVEGVWLGWVKGLKI